MSQRKTTDRKGTGRETRQRRRERGQSLVEMAIAVPILILILAVMVDASRIFDALIVLTQAVREGARLGTIQPELNADEITDVVVEDVLGSGTNITYMDEMTDDNVEVTIVEGEVVAEVIVKAWYDFDLWFGGLLGIPTIRVSRQAVMPSYYQLPTPTPGPTNTPEP